MGSTAQRWGATVAEWEFFSDKLQLVEDLLPLVSNPKLPISENSNLKKVGKTPSIVNGAGYVAGIPDWTNRKSRPSDVAKWSKNDNYGICIQTRRVRAFDIDIADRDVAERVAALIARFAGPLPRRFRADSGKCLLAFRLGGEFSKRILKTEWGVIEFLANGQQFVAAGTHEAGRRYEWSGLDGGVPELSVESFETIWAALAEEFGGEEARAGGRRNQRDDSATADTDDKTLNFLLENNLVLGFGGEDQAFIECPFKHEHTSESGVSSTAYFPAGGRGYQQGHFVCLHAHCAGRKDVDFLDALGVRDEEFDVVIAEPAEPKELPTLERDKLGRPLATLNNIMVMVDRPDVSGVVPVIDSFRDEMLLYDSGRTKWERADDTFFVRMRVLLEREHRFRPIGKDLMRDAVAVVADKNRIDSGREWIKSLEWDGKHRIGRFLTNYLNTEDSPYTRAVSNYIWTALAGRALVPGLKVDMVPILQGEQGIMKSSAIAAMAPSPELFVEVSFGERDPDIARKIRGKFVAEIPELKGLRSRELESIKAFVTRTHEEWIPKFKEFSSTFPRRVVFFGTTNDEQFLMDTTGNRRWLPFRVPEAVDVEGIRRDCKQLWAEGRVLFEQSGLQFRDAEFLARKEHDKYMLQDTWLDVISKWLVTPDIDGQRPCDDVEGLRLTEVLRFALNMDPMRAGRADEMKAGDALKKLGYYVKSVYDPVEGRSIRKWFTDIDVPRREDAAGGGGVSGSADKVDDFSDLV